MNHEIHEMHETHENGFYPPCIPLPTENKKPRNSLKVTGL